MRARRTRSTSGGQPGRPEAFGAKRDRARGCESSSRLAWWPQSLPPSGWCKVPKRAAHVPVAALLPGVPPAIPIAADRRQVVRLHGRLTARSGARLLDALRTLSPAPTHVEVDLSGVTDVDRSGATLLVDAYVATVLRRSGFALSGLSAECRRCLECSGVLDIVDVIDVSLRTNPPGRYS